MKNNLILTRKKVQAILRRMALQIIENNLDEAIALVGVDKGGRELANEIANYLEAIAKIDAKTYTLTLDKIDPLNHPIDFDGNLNELHGKSVILCDDVLNSGKTLAYGLTTLLSQSLSKVETAVLILRSHSKYPIYANYKGYELSTTINEHVTVVPGEGVYLD